MFIEYLLRPIRKIYLTNKVELKLKSDQIYRFIIYQIYDNFAEIDDIYCNEIKRQEHVFDVC